MWKRPERDRQTEKEGQADRQTDRHADTVREESEIEIIRP